MVFSFTPVFVTTVHPVIKEKSTEVTALGDVTDYCKSGFVMLGLSLPKGQRVGIAVSMMLEFVSDIPLSTCGVIWNIG